MTALALTLTALLTAVAPAHDTVVLHDGGRLVGTVVREDLGTGITIRLLDGSFVSKKPADVARIEYADGTLGTLGVVVPPEPPPPPPRAPRMAAPQQGWFAAGLAVAVAGGYATEQTMDVVAPDGIAVLQLDGGWMLAPGLGLGVVLDLGYGTGPMKLSGYSYFGSTVTILRADLQARYHFMPTSAVSPWLSLGVGWEGAWVHYDEQTWPTPTTSWSGPEFVRLGIGVDARVSDAVGLGLYVSASDGKYQGGGHHQWIQLGVRLLPSPSP